MFDPETRVLPQEFPERFPLVGGGVVKQNNDGATQVPQQLAQKHTDLFLRDVVKKEQIVEAQVVALGAERNSGDHRDFVSSPLAMPKNGGLPLRRPGSGHRGN